MNNGMPTQKEVERLRTLYPPGTRIELQQMNDPHHPVEPGTRGTVQFVDDCGHIHMGWDNGRTLSLVPSEDSFSIINDQDESPVFEQTM